MLENFYSSKHEQSLNLFFQIRGFNDERDKYLAFKNGKLVSFDYDINLSMQILMILEQLGFSKDEIGTYAYKELIKKVVYLLNEGINDKKIVELLQKHYSQLYVDVARNELGIGVDTFHNDINNSIYNINDKKVNKNLAYEIFNNYQHLDYDIQAYVLAKYMLENMELKQEKSKVLKLKENS